LEKKTGPFTPIQLGKQAAGNFCSHLGVDGAYRALMAPEAVATLPYALIVHGQALMAPEAASEVRILVFFARFQSFFRLQGKERRSERLF
jgi:hypothetical protein